MLAEGDLGGEWTVQFLEIQKCSVIGNACLLNEISVRKY